MIIDNKDIKILEEGIIKVANQKDFCRYNCFLNYVRSNESQGNQRSQRQIKANLRDKFISKTSEYIDYYDQIGSDLIMNLDKILDKFDYCLSEDQISIFRKYKKVRIECKYVEKGILYSQLKKQEKTHAFLVLSNTDSKKEKKFDKDNYATMIFCIDLWSISLVSTYDIEKNNLIDFSKEGKIVAKIPRKFFKILFDHKNKNFFDYKINSNFDKNIKSFGQNEYREFDEKFNELEKERTNEMEKTIKKRTNEMEKTKRKMNSKFFLKKIKHGIKFGYIPQNFHIKDASSFVGRSPKQTKRHLYNLRKQINFDEKTKLYNIPGLNALEVTNKKEILYEKLSKTYIDDEFTFENALALSENGKTQTRNDINLLRRKGRIEARYDKKNNNRCYYKISNNLNKRKQNEDNLFSKIFKKIKTYF